MSERHEHDAALVIAAQGGCDDAFWQLVAAHHPAWRSLAARLVPWDQTEDVAHDVVLSVRRHLGDLQSPAAFQSWSNQIVRSTARAHRRAATQGLGRDPGQIDQLADHATPEHVAMQRDDARRLVHALSTLTPRDRDLLTAWHAAGEPLHRLADRLQLTPDSARNALSRARRRAASAWQQASGLLVALGLWRRRRFAATTSPANQLIAASLAIELGALAAVGLLTVAPAMSRPPAPAAASMAIGTTTSFSADHLDDANVGGVPTNGVTTVPSLRRESPPIADAEVVVVTRPEQLPPGEDVRVTVTVEGEEYGVRLYLDDVERESGQDIDAAVDLGPAA